MTSYLRRQRWQIIPLAIIGLALILVAILFVKAFQLLPIDSPAIAFDWKLFWPVLQWGNIHYNPGLVMNPPWMMLVIAPLATFPLATGWALLSFITTLILIISIPRVKPRWRYWLSIVLLLLSFPALRHLMDGNFEALIVAGALLIVYGYRSRSAWILALGVILITSKPQSSILVAAALGLLALLALRQGKEVAFWLKVAAIVLAVIVPTLLWKGAEWLQAISVSTAVNGPSDASLRATLLRLGLPGPLIATLWAIFLVVNVWLMWQTRTVLTREKVAALITASMLLSPYTGGLGILAVTAVGLIPIFQKHPLAALPPILLMNSLFFFSVDKLVQYQATVLTAALLLVWSVLYWYVHQNTRKQPN